MARCEATLAYADANRNNMPLIRAILDKAREGNAGLSHREASVLLACEDRGCVRRGLRTGPGDQAANSTATAL